MRAWAPPSTPGVTTQKNGTSSMVWRAAVSTRSRAGSDGAAFNLSTGMTGSFAVAHHSPCRIYILERIFAVHGAPEIRRPRLPGRRARDRRRARAARRDGWRDRRAPRGAGWFLLSPLSVTRRTARGIVATHGARFPTGDHRRARCRRRLARRAPHAAMGAHPSRRSARPAAL